MGLGLIKKSEFDKVYARKDESNSALQLFADMCRFNTLVAIKQAGSGHLGSSLSAMDIVVYLYLREMNVLTEGFNSPNRDIYFSSKGHDVPGLYSVFFALGIVSEAQFMGLRKLHGLDGHPNVQTEGIEANTGSLGMGISKARGFAFAKNYRKNSGNVFVLTGDGEFQEGQIYESLQATAHQKVANITAIMDHNQYQTDMLVKDVNNIEILEEKISAFGWHTVRIDGHNYDSLRKTITALKSVTDKPKFIIADTVKGKGVSFMEVPYTIEDGKAFYKWHSGAPEDEYFLKGIAELQEKISAQASALGVAPIIFPEISVDYRIVSKAAKEFVTEAYGDELVELGKTHSEIIVLDGDLAADCKLRKFENTYPARFIENGIAEQDMVSLAGGIARMGLLPIVNTFASFLTARANEQIYNNACEHTKIIYTCHFAGMIPAGPGKSHQSVRDISLLGALPNITIIQPCNGIETKAALRYLVEECPHNGALRLVIGPSPRNIELPEAYAFEYGKGTILRAGDEALLFAYGPVMLHEALVAHECLAAVGFQLSIINMPWLNRIDLHWLEEVTEPHKNIFVLEDHSVIGGLSDRILNGLSELNTLWSKQYSTIGLEDYPESGTPFEVLEHHKLDGKSIALRIAGPDVFKMGFGNSQKGSTHKKGDYTEAAPQ